MSHILDAPFIRKAWPPENRAIFIFYSCPVYFPSATSVSLPRCPPELLSWGPLPRTLALLITDWAVGVASLQLFLLLGLFLVSFPLGAACSFLPAPSSDIRKSGSKDRFGTRNWECYSVGTLKALVQEREVWFTPTLLPTCCVIQAKLSSSVSFPGSESESVGWGQ